MLFFWVSCTKSRLCMIDINVRFIAMDMHIKVIWVVSPSVHIFCFGKLCMRSFYDYMKKKEKLIYLAGK